MSDRFDRNLLRRLVPGVSVFLIAIPLAYWVYLADDVYSGLSNRARVLAAVGLVCVSSLPTLAYLVKRMRSANPTKLALIAAATASVLSVSVYLYEVSFYVFFPADLLIWSETDYLNDILKFRSGYPIYSPEVNNESYTYTPGSQILTYMLASLLGNPTSIPLYRVLQLVYTLFAVAVATRCCHLLLVLSGWKPLQRGGRLWEWIWGVVLFSTLFLIATNSLTNPFIHNLHNDALAQLISVLAYFLLIKYAISHDKRVLAAMIFIPAIGFMVKQNLALWGGFYCIYFAFLARPRSTSRLLIFSLAGFAVLCGTILACYTIWGDDFVYWVFYVLAEHKVTPSRSFGHLISARGYLLIGLLGGAVLLRGKNFTPLFGVWAVWLMVFAAAIYTAGINFMRHHMGPASLIAGIWFMSAVLRVWPRADSNEPAKAELWLRSGLAAAMVGLFILDGLGIVRNPERPLSPDAYRYLGEIEREFDGQSAEKILLDVGSWVYMDKGIIMKDRASPIGERGMSETGDFSGILSRLKNKHYSKLLVHNLHNKDFWYDHPLWPRSSGIRDLLLTRYTEVGRIPAVAGQESSWSRYPVYGLAEISILVPN